MEINATLLGQALVFGILYWFSWKFIWPPLTKAVEDRQKKIADGPCGCRAWPERAAESHGDAAVDRERGP